MKSKLIIFLLLLSVAGFSQIRHDQLRKPIIESTDTVLMFKNTSMGFEYTRTVLDTTIIKGLDLFVKERVSDSTNYLLGRLNDTITYILGQIPTTLVELDSSGFRITESQILDLKNYLTTEADPKYANDSIEIVWFKDLKFTQDSLKTAIDSIQAHNLRLLEKQSISDTLTWDATKYDLEQLKLTDLDSTGFSVDTTQVRDLLEFVQNNGGGGSGDGYWEETVGGDTIQNNNAAPVKIQTSLLFGDEEVVTGSTGMFVYAGVNNLGTTTEYPMMKSSDYGATFNGLEQSGRYIKNIATNNTGQYVAYTSNANVLLSDDYGETWSTKSFNSAIPISMSNDGQKMISSYFSGNTYYISTNYGSTFSNVTAVGTTGYFTCAHISGDGNHIYLNGSESTQKVYHSSDGVNFTTFGGTLETGGVWSNLSSDGAIYIVWDNYKIKKSTNRGSWVDITPSVITNIYGQIDLTPSGNVIGITNSNNTAAVVSRNGGEDWYLLPSGSAVKFVSISLSSDGNAVYLGGNNGRVYKYEWTGTGYTFSASILIGNGDAWVSTNKGTSSVSVHPFEVEETEGFLEASVNDRTAFRLNQDGQFGLRTGGFASKINTTVTGDFSALITDKAVKDYIDGSGSTMVYPPSGIPVSLGTSWRSTSIPPAVGYLYYNGVNYTWNSGSSDGNNYPTTLVYTAADRQLTLGRNGLSSISTFFPLASATDAGMIKVGSGLSIDGNGVLSSSGGSMVYPSGSGIPTINSGAWGTTISPSNGYLNYNNGSWSFSTPSGGGDMFKSTYDTNSNNIVDNSEALGGVAASNYATLTGNQTLTNKSVNGVTLSTSQGTTKFLRGDGTYAAPPSGGGGVGGSYNGQILYNNSGSVSGFGSYNPTSSVLDLSGSTRVLHTQQLNASFDRLYNTVWENITFGSNFKSATGGGSGYNNGELGSAITTSTAFSLDVSINYNWFYMNSTLTDALTTGTIQFTAYNITDDTFVFKTYNVVIKRTGTTVSYLSKVETSTVGSDTASLSESISVSYAYGSYTTTLGVTRNTTKQHNIRIVFIGSVIPLIRPN